jgi:P pilus assembly chaperone PapD
MKNLPIVIPALLLAALTVSTLAAQGVVVAPHTVFIDHRARSGEVQLFNPGNDPVEVSVGIFFGYPVSDSTGGFELRSIEAPDSSMPSAAGWIQAFPRIITLGPKETQVVRLLARPPAGLRDGEYWARLTVSARGQAPVATAPADSTGVSVGLNLEVRTVIPLLYRKGVVATGIKLDGLSLGRGLGDSLEVKAHLTRSGNSAFLGVIRAAIVDSTGTNLATLTSPIAVYYEMSPRIRVAMPPLNPGRYRLRIEVASDRSDLQPKDILPVIPVRDSLEVRLP